MTCLIESSMNADSLILGCVIGALIGGIFMILLLAILDRLKKEKQK